MGMIISRIVLDLHAGYEQASISIKAGDTGRSVSVRLTENGVPFIPKNGYFAVITVKKPDGTYIYNDCTIYSDGRIEFTVTSQFAAAEGICNCELRIYNSEGELVISPRFTAVVYAPVLSDSAVESSSEFTALTQRLIQADEALNEANEAANTANEAAAEAFAAAEGVIYLYDNDSYEVKMQKIGDYFTKITNDEKALLIYVSKDGYNVHTCILTTPSLYLPGHVFSLSGEYTINTTETGDVSYLVKTCVGFSGTFTTETVDGATVITVTDMTAISETVYVPDSNNLATRTYVDGKTTVIANTDSDEVIKQKLGQWFTALTSSNLLKVPTAVFVANNINNVSAAVFDFGFPTFTAVSGDTYNYTVRAYMNEGLSQNANNNMTYLIVNSVSFSGTCTIIDGEYTVTDVTVLQRTLHIPSDDGGDMATRTYVDDNAVKRDKTSAFKVYGVSNADTPVMVPYSTAAGNYTLVYRDNNGCAKVNAPTNDLDAANKKYVDDTAVAKSTTANMLYGRSNGEEFAFPVSTAATAWNIPRRNATGQIVSTEPTEDNHLATKKYVDDTAVHTVRASFSLSENSTNTVLSGINTDGVVTTTTGFAVATISVQNNSSGVTGAVTALAGCNVILVRDNSGYIYPVVTRQSSGITGDMAEVSGYIDVWYKG